MSETDSKTYGALLPLDEGAQWLGVSTETLRKWAQNGDVETHKLFGRRLISEDEIIRLIEMSRVPARSETRPRVKNLAGTTRDRVFTD